MKDTMGFDSLPITFKYVPENLQQVVYKAAKDWNDEKIALKKNKLHLDAILEHENNRKRLETEKAF